MDVKLQILKHLPRDAQPTVSFIDQYCSYYKDLLPEVRSYEYLKYLQKKRAVESQVALALG
ncbi:hypothetical protein [Okeania sp. SIO2C9]|uniref:hypothetical protein n=1 Tax=Okeania sp. SIO2C9 TaxID=2607791 RepID=UPI0035C89065